MRVRSESPKIFMTEAPKVYVLRRRKMTSEGRSAMQEGVMSKGSGEQANLNPCLCSI